MTEFLYKTKDDKGRVTEAVAQADSPAVLRARLTARGINVLEIKPRLAPGSVEQKWASFMSKFEKVKLKDMVVFSRQFSSMVSAGVAMLRTLIIMIEQCENPKMKRTLESVRKAVESGTSLSDAFAKHPDVFDKLYVSMVRAGEAGGILDEVLKRLADFLEAREKLNSKVKSAMAYPTVVFSVALIVFWAMLTFILPIFQHMFDTIGGEMPAYTMFLIHLSEMMRSPWMLLFVGCVVGAVIGVKSWYATDIGKHKIDAAILKLPVFGEVVRKVAIARFSRTFGTLIRSGVPMLSALDVVRDTAGNAILSDSIEQVHKEVREGGSISRPMAKAGMFPPMVTQMVAVGEETGRLDDMLSKVADFYDNEVENSVDAMTSILEPIMVVGIGGIVGSVVVGMYLPIFSIITQIQ